MKIVTVIGARPQFVKAATVSRALKAHPTVREVLVHTGQHYDANMSDVFFAELDMAVPDHFLGVGSGLHGDQTGRILAAVEKVLVDEAPDCLLVYGDTNSTLAGALAAAKIHIPVAHVEAGLRSFNRAMPEEINRVLTDHVSNRLYAPTTTAVLNLQREGIAGDQVVAVGDVMLDAAMHYAKLAGSRSTVLERNHLRRGAYILATIHRAENTDNNEKLAAIFEGLNAIARREHVVIPVHPRTRQALARAGFSPVPGLALLDPIGYLDMTTLEKFARLVVTDSGGVQKEAFFHRVLCVTLRTETEWVELVEAGWNRLVPPVTGASIADAVLDALTQPSPAHWPEHFGDGHAAKKIATDLVHAFGVGV